MKIYTKTGDSGNTSLFGGKRVDKDNQRIEAYGTLDELNSVIGLILVEKVNDKTRKILTILQQSLFVIGSELATPSDVQSKAIRPLTNEEISVLENYIDEIDVDLPSLKNFIIPGGTKISLPSSLCKNCLQTCREENC
jgi:cob(I)alamin adenosyltransferase